MPCALCGMAGNIICSQEISKKSLLSTGWNWNRVVSIKGTFRTKNLFFVSSPLKSVTNYGVVWMGLNFYDYIHTMISSQNLAVPKHPIHSIQPLPMTDAQSHVTMSICQKTTQKGFNHYFENKTTSVLDQESKGVKKSSLII